MNSSIFDKKSELQSKLYACANEMKISAEAYFSKFNADGILRLFDEQSDEKKYFERYTEFANKLSDSLKDFENYVAVVSMLVCDADQNCDTQKTAYFSAIFEQCDTLLRSISAFFECNNKNFDKNGSFKAALTLNSARELRGAIDTFCTSLKAK